MIWLVFVLCVLAAILNAASSLAEREASRKPNVGKLFSRHFTYAIIRDRKFLLGLVLQVFASLFEVIALKIGSLVVIGPLLTLDIVFLWIFISYRYRLEIRPKNWLAVILVMVGISLVFISARPTGGSLNYSGYSWSWAIGGVLLLVGIAYFISKTKMEPKLKSICLGIATAANYALDAGLVKLVFNQLKTQDLTHMFVTWPLYTLLFFVVLSIVMTQNTYAAGPIAISQPVIEVVQAIISVLIGVFLFHDALKHSLLSTIGLILGLVSASTGIVLMATTKRLFDHSG